MLSFEIFIFLFSLTLCFGEVVQWRCPILDIDPGTISCSCHAARQALQCEFLTKQESHNLLTEEDISLSKLTSALRTLPEESTVNLLEVRLFNRTGLKTGIFTNLPSLHGLVISGATNINPDVFSDVSDSLEAIGLPYNRLKVFPSSLVFPLRNNLLRLDLSNNVIRYVRRSDVDELTKVTNLDLSGNVIEHIDDNALRNMKNLIRLNLSKNRVTVDSLRAEIKGLSGYSKLQVLWLKDNQLDGNITSKLLRNLPNLTTLDLSHNRFVSILPDSFEDLTNLEVLDLSYNRLSHIFSGAFNQLKRLTHLTLSHNMLGALGSGVLYPLPMLTHLEVDSNFLTDIYDGILGQLTSLRVLSFRDNDIMTVQPSAFKNLTRLQVIRLDDNPFHCDCNLRDLAEWLKSNSQLISVMKRAVVCASPPRLEDHTLVDVDVTQLRCMDSVEEIGDYGEDGLLSADGFSYHESLSNTEVRMEEFHFQNGVITSRWSVDESIRPYRCDAAFIYEDLGDHHKLWAKMRITCDDKTQSDPKYIEIATAGIHLDSSRVYRVCLVLISKSAIHPGCSEAIALPNQWGESVETETSSEDGLTFSIGTPTVHHYLPKLPEYVGVSDDSTTPGKDKYLQEPVLYHVSVMSEDSVRVYWRFPEVRPPPNCRLAVIVFLKESSVANTSMKCDRLSTVISGLKTGELYNVCVNSEASRSWSCHDATLAVPSHSSSGQVAVILAVMFAALSLLMIIAIAMLAKRLLKRKGKKPRDFLASRHPFVFNYRILSNFTGSKDKETQAINGSPGSLDTTL